jgi:hypothetical protein
MRKASGFEVRCAAYAACGINANQHYRDLSDIGS